MNTSSLYNSSQQINSNERNQYSYKQAKLWCHLCRKSFSKLIDSNMNQDIFCQTCQAPCEIIESQHDNPQSFRIYTDNERNQQNQNQQSNAQKNTNQQQQPSNSQQNQQQRQGNQRQFFIQTTQILSPGIHITQFTFPNMPFQEEEQQENRNQGIPFGIFDHFINPFNSFFHNHSRNVDFERLIEQFLANDPNNYGPKPAEKNQIEKLTCKTIEKDCNEQCSVCQEQYKKNEKMTELPCKHNFHQECISEWLGRHNSCPICRKAI